MKPNFLQSEIVSEVTPLLCYDQRIQFTTISSVFCCLSATFWCELSTKVCKFLFAKLQIVILFIAQRDSLSIQVLLKLLSQDLRLIVKLLYQSILSYDYQIVILSPCIYMLLQLFLRIVVDIFVCCDKSCYHISLLVQVSIQVSPLQAHFFKKLPKLASSILNFCRRKRFFQWYPDQSDWAQ